MREQVLLLVCDGGLNGEGAYISYVIFNTNSWKQKIVRDDWFEVHRLSKCHINVETSNQAEYVAMIMGLEWLYNKTKGRGKVEVRTDSKLVVNQINGIYRVESENLIRHNLKILDILSRFENINIRWWPRKFSKNILGH